MNAALIQIAPGDPHWTSFVEELARAGLPTVDLTSDGQRFFAMKVGGQIVAYGGFGILGTDALLRSIVVQPGGRRLGVGRQLVAELLALVGTSGAEKVWVLTTSAADFFARLGFESRPRDAAPPAIAATSEFSSLCRASAVLMCRSPA